MLGRGLESLIPNYNSGDNTGGDLYTQQPKEEQQPEEQDAQEVENPQQEPKPQEVHQISGPVFHLEVGKVVFNPYQPRKIFDPESLQELSASIRELGILQPLVVTKREKESEHGTTVEYQLIAGQRRLMAAKMLGMQTVPAIVRITHKDTEALELALVENIQRTDLSVIEVARAYARLSDEFGLTQREIATRLGKSREAVANSLRLLSLPTVIQDAISKNDVSESHARILLQVSDPAQQQSLFDEVVARNLSVRDLKRRLSQSSKPSPQREQAPIRADDVQMKQLGEVLAEYLGAPVKIDFSRNGGKIIIHFYSPEEADGIVRRIKPTPEEF